MTESIQFGSKKIPFHLSYSQRKTLGITITPDMNVRVIAPFDSPLEKVKTKVKSKAAWILKQQSFFLTYHPKTPRRKYVSGETHLFLGRQYMLQVRVGSPDQVKRIGRILHVTTHEKSNAGALLRKWYRQKAEEKFIEISKPLLERFAKFKLNPPRFTLQDMPTRWGSCTAKGKIILNPELVKAPKGCIEYVIVHELCHLIYRDHTQKFIDLQSKAMRDWEKWKMKLERLLA